VAEHLEHDRVPCPVSDLAVGGEALSPGGHAKGQDRDTFDQGPLEIEERCALAHCEKPIPTSAHRIPEALTANSATPSRSVGGRGVSGAETAVAPKRAEISSRMSRCRTVSAEQRSTISRTSVGRRLGGSAHESVRERLNTTALGVEARSGRVREKRMASWSGAGLVVVTTRVDASLRTRSVSRPRAATQIGRA